MKEILEAIVELTRRREAAALASVVAASGSLPMSRRSKMLVLAAGTQIGTVGGGCLEAEVHAMARESSRTASAALRRFTLTEAMAGADGLNCGGTVEVLVEPVGGVSPAPFMEVYRWALAALEAREESVLVTALMIPATSPDGTSRAEIAGKGLVGWKGMRIGSGVLARGNGESPLAAYAAEEALGILGQDRAGFVRVAAPLGSGSTRLFLETVDAPPTLYLFGGGHVSLAVARVARTAGFRVVVVDDRPAFANPGRFPEADRALVMPMEGAVSNLPIDRDSFIVAVTRGHKHDEPVIEQAIRTPAAYIGMIGSRRKVAVMWERLRSRGATDEQLSRVHAPIGLAIRADTPGEIAVSIVAQMIEIRRRAK